MSAVTPISQQRDIQQAEVRTFRQRVSAVFGSYTFRVIMQGLLTIWAVVTFTFFLIRLLPGNPIDIKIDQLMQQRNITYEEALGQAAALYHFDANAPLFQQYLTYLGQLVQGDLGESITSAGTQVSAQILRYLPWTLFSLGLALLISFTVGVLIGLAMAYWRGGILDNVMTVFASILYGIPDYVIALFLIIVVGIQWGWFSPGQMRGGVDPSIQPGLTLEYIGSVLYYAILPVTTYVLGSIGGWMLTMKSSTIAALGEDYITVAKARGLPERRVLTAYVGRNAMLPLVTRLAISIGFIVSGSVIVEELFQYPGLGRNLLRVINGRDYTTMQGIFLVITISVVFANVASDLMFGLLDPRVRVGKGKDV